MTGTEIIARVKALHLPEGQYVVFGSCPIALAGLREANDIDMLVSSQLLQDLAKQGWQQIDKGDQDKPFTYDVFEAHDSWNYASYNPTLQQLLATAKVVEGIPFVSLQEVRQWKVVSGRPKDLQDVALIDNYLQRGDHERKN